mmetsp:Transcript_4047/g.10381  ORF Transcript_4047/g.10381 Transcript_4047/m.10381 type:complete len:91 (-) Transcript_4047:5143-5415(-)
MAPSRRGVGGVVPPPPAGRVGYRLTASGMDYLERTDKLSTPPRTQREKECVNIRQDEHMTPAECQDHTMRRQCCSGSNCDCVHRLLLPDF